jgi:hypothetical protein
VSTLIDNSTGRWDYPLIQANFVRAEADKIYSLPLSTLNQPDRLIWSGTHNKCFTVRSAYHMELTNRSLMEGECSSAAEQQGVWNTIWSLDVPEVVKNFAWKLGNNLLPTKERLVQRYIGQDLFFPFCLIHTESACHIMWECPSSVALWQECSRRVQKLALHVNDGLDFLQQILSKLEEAEVVEVLSVARLIWLWRNAYVFQKEFGQV